MHSKEKYRDHETYKKNRAIIQVYTEASALGESEEESETRTFCTDEMNDIQALKRVFLNKPTAPGMDAKREFDDPA